MKLLPVQYCYFSFRDGGEKHDLRVSVTPSLSLQYTLYINDVSIGTVTDSKTNILLPGERDRAFSFETIWRVYEQLLTKQQFTLPFPG